MLIDRDAAVRSAALCLIFALVAVNAYGRAKISTILPHGRDWYDRAARRLITDEYGRLVTPQTHPEEFEVRPMVSYYRHGWPLPAVTRSAYLGNDLMWDPDTFPRSNPWPVDSGEIYRVHGFKLALNVLIGIGIVVIGCLSVSAMFALCCGHSPIKSDAEEKG